MPESPQSDLLTTLGEALARGAVALAPNERAAGDLRARFDHLQSLSGLGAWEPAQIRSWNAWLSTLWSDLITTGSDQRLLLNPAQEHILWREVINAGPEFESLGSLDSLADLAQSAWRLAASYEATADLRRFAATHDSRIFAAWAADFRKRCDKQQYLSTADLPAALREHITNATITPPTSLLLIGFDDDTPARTNLLATLTNHGCKIDRLTITEPATLRTIVRATNPTDETTTAAHWIRTFIQSTTTTPRIALIVPKLHETRPTLEATLRNILAPELQSITTDLSSTPYAFSTGTPLADTSMVATALDLIRWIADPLTIDNISTLLLSPYVGLSAEIPERAAFDAFALRQTPLLRLDLDIAAVARLSTTYPAVTHLLTPLATRAARLTPAPRSYADWMEFIRDTLRDANFPGDRPLNAQEFRDARTWDHVLDAVATLDFTGPRVTFATALDALQRTAREASSAHGTNSAAVQVMTPTEAAGSSFDAIVFLQATDANWPANERTNPLLAWPLQLDRQMPGTDPARTAQRAGQATQRLIDAAPNVLFLYPAEDENGPQRLSAIIEHLGWPEVPSTQLIAPLPTPALIPLEAFEDTAPLPPLPSEQVSGGARVLKQQAACGFLAFSELRLRSKPIDDLAAGLDALESGNFLHRAMQAFWAEVHSQDDLRKMDPTQREALLKRCIAGAVDHKIQPETDWDAAYLQLQKDRLLILLRSWLNEELNRGPFTVLALEESTLVNVGPLTLSVRIDRIDRVANGFVYVDYKTGSAANPRHWGSQRPEEPQLPLYALLAEPGELQGLAFAKVRAGKDMTWLGYQAEPGILPMKRPRTLDLDLLIDEWRHTLATLADDFASGRATVSPKDFATNCARCAQRLLCRVNPELLLLTVDDENGDDAE